MYTNYQINIMIVYF